MVSEVKVELIDHMGSDVSVVNAARVSFDKVSAFDGEGDLPVGDKRLIRYLALHNHWSPFGHAFLQFRVTAPIAVARQLVKHQVGLCWNEVSRRYVDSAPEYYRPDTWRGRPTDKKQGSSEIEITSVFDSQTGVDIHPASLFEESIEYANTVYTDLIKAGVAPEQARMVLPQNTMTSWIWSGSLYAFARIDSLRTKPDAQQETREVAEHFGKNIKKIFPVSWHYLTNTAEINKLTIIKDFVNENNLKGFDHIFEQHRKLFDFE